MPKKLHAIWNAYTERCMSRHVAVHPTNRGGAGLLPAHCISLFGDFTRDGWSWPEVNGRARAFERQPGEIGQKQLATNLEWIDSACGMLRSISKDDIRFLSVTCGHTVSSLENALQGTLAPGAKPAHTTNGRWCCAKVVQATPSMEDPIKNGIEWEVVRAAVEVVCPSLPNFLQLAGNLGHSTQKPVTKVQALLQLQLPSVTVRL